MLCYDFFSSRKNNVVRSNIKLVNYQFVTIKESHINFQDNMARARLKKEDIRQLLITCDNVIYVIDTTNLFIGSCLM